MAWAICTSTLWHVSPYNYCDDPSTITRLTLPKDVTKKSSRSRLRLHFPNSAVDIEKGRYRFIGCARLSRLWFILKRWTDIRKSIWRPLSGPYQDSALAVCDSRTVSHNDLVPADVVFPHYCDEGYEVKHNESHRWFYKRGMTTDDVILLKHFDSDYSEASCKLRDLCSSRQLIISSLPTFSLHRRHCSSRHTDSS